MYCSYLKIPNGIPLVYNLDDNLQPQLDFTDDLGFQAKYLVSARNHSKVVISRYYWPKSCSFYLLGYAY